MATTTPEIVRINYDDECLDIIDKINKALRTHGIRLVDDNLSHDGFCLFVIEKIEGSR